MFRLAACSLLVLLVLFAGHATAWAEGESSAGDAPANKAQAKDAQDNETPGNETPADEAVGRPSDPFAGKTVKDRKFGYAVIRGRAGNVPKVGDKAPDFVLKTADGKQTVRLSSFATRRPVVLIFGSFT